jgi:hypothetical protein
MTLVETAAETGDAVNTIGEMTMATPSSAALNLVDFFMGDFLLSGPLVLIKPYGARASATDFCARRTWLGSGDPWR